MTENFRKKVVNKDFDLNDSSNVRTGRAVDRDYSFSANLEIARLPKQAGVDGPRSLAASVIQWSDHCEIDQRNDVSKRQQPVDLFYMIIKVGQAVFDGDSPVQRVWID